MDVREGDAKEEEAEQQDGVSHRNENAVQLEEVGTVDKVVFSSRCFVFAQSWPSWSFTLSSMGCTDLVTAVEWGCAISRKEFEATELKTTIVQRLGIRNFS